MNDIQALFNAISETGRRDRSHYHVTLGKLIAVLKGTDPSLPVQFAHGGAPFEPHSYRGYYSDLAFHTTNDRVLVAHLLNKCNEALGKTFEGYKGGDFVMSEDTPLWNACYGCCGDAIVDLTVLPDRVVLTTKNVDDLILEENAPGH